MPAVSVCDPVAAALRHSLDAVQGKGGATDAAGLAVTIAGNASRILQTEIRYEETDGYRSTLLDHLKAKYIVLSLPINGAAVDGGNNHQQQAENARNSCGASATPGNPRKSRTMGPSLPEPAITLYAPEKVNLGWKGTFPVGAGMYNVGNTCYLNSTLQALFHVPALVNWLLSDAHHTSKCEQNDGGGECLTCAVAKTLQFSHEKSGSAIKPFYIYNKLKLICRTMVPGQQEDAHEFLRYLLEGMERAYLARHRATKLDSYSKETTPVNQIFGGYIRTEVKCLQCRHVSTTFQHFQDLLVDIRKASTLDEALSSYFSKEHLDNNDYKCEACKRRVPATKQFSLERAPKVLCVQLKRFSVLGGKISRHIGFKQTVDMGPYLWREPNEPERRLTYRLTSMVTHMGPSVNCGHYTAVAQVSTGQFYTFDDSCVRSVNVGNVMNTNAYIIIFEMEAQQEATIHVAPAAKTSAANIPKISNGIHAKSSSSSSSSLATTSASAATANGEFTNGAARKTHDADSAVFSPTNSPAAAAKINSSVVTSAAGVKSTNFIGPQLPARLAESKQPRLVMHIKNGKVLSGSSLVPYEGSSDEDEAIVLAAPAKPIVANSGVATAKSPGGGINGAAKSSSKDSTSSSPKFAASAAKETTVGKFAAKDAKTARMNCGNSAGATKTPNGIAGASGASGSNGTTSQKHQNGKSEVAGRNGEQPAATTTGKEKWHPSRAKTANGEEKIATKAAASSSNGWQVSKDEPAPTSGSTSNGWSVTDNKEGKSSSASPSVAAPSAAAPRSFNGTNRSETVSHLLKMSNRGYGTSSVSSWNGGRAHLEREVDSERREERKRHHDPEDEEMDRGRTKKTKTHRDYEGGRSNPGYNPFQEYQNGKTWSRGPSGGSYYGKRHYYNTSNGRGNRSQRHSGNNSHRPHHGQNYRCHNYSRDHWQR